MVGHATERHVILVLGNYVIRVVVRLDVVRGGVIRLRLYGFRDLGHVIFVMVHF